MEQFRFDRSCPRLDSGLFLGKLIIRNFHGDFSDPGFKNFIESEMEDRGAPYGCLAGFYVKRQDTYQVSHSNPSAPGAAGARVYETGIGIATIEFYSTTP